MNLKSTEAQYCGKSYFEDAMHVPSRSKDLARRPHFVHSTKRMLRWFEHAHKIHRVIQVALVPTSQSDTNNLKTFQS